MATIAAVAIYFSFGKSNDVKKAARRAPPVPTSPAKNPEMPPPMMLLVVVGLACKSFFKSDMTEYRARKMPRIAFRVSCGRFFAKKAPMIVNNMLGNPNFIIRFLSMPYLKKAIRPRFPNR